MFKVAETRHPYTGHHGQIVVQAHYHARPLSVSPFLFGAEAKVDSDPAGSIPSGNFCNTPR